MENLARKWIIVRADAGMEMGSGHLMRTLALAQSWKDHGGRVVFITGCRYEKLLKRLYDEGFIVRTLGKSYPDNGDWAITKNILAEYPDAWVVLDGYHFDEAYQKLVKDSGHRLLVIDDYAHLKHYYPDILLNQNLGAKELPYSCEPYTKLLLGTRYVLLRREFLGWKNLKRVIPEVAKHLLVTLGGTDPTNVTLMVIQALQEIDLPGLEATVVVGASNPNVESIGEAAKQSRLPIRLMYNAENMAELMAWADAAVSAGGSTSWELAFMGLPAVQLTIADNQREIARSLGIAGVATDLGWYSKITPAVIKNALSSLILKRSMRAEMSAGGRRLVNGQGASRVVLLLT